MIEQEIERHAVIRSGRKHKYSYQIRVAPHPPSSLPTPTASLQHYAPPDGASLITCGFGWRAQPSRRASHHSGPGPTIPPCQSEAQLAHGLGSLVRFPRTSRFGVF
jgi:hypothetical protein